MSNTLTVACVQNSATPSVDENLDTTLRLTREAVSAGAKLICTPEYFSGLATKDGAFLPVAFDEGNHPVLSAYREEAREHGVWVLLGSLGIIASTGRIWNRSYLIDSSGTIAARYNKIHLFDVSLGEGKDYKESATIEPGNQAVVAETPWGGLGLSICYDLRFADLYRALAKGGASMLAVPAAFTKITGEAHWHVLNRARAIETGSFVIAPCQYGTISGGGECFGHSLIVDPWGKVLADGGDGEGIAIAEIDIDDVGDVRQRIPALQHDRPFQGPGRLAAAE